MNSKSATLMSFLMRTCVFGVSLHSNPHVEYNMSIREFFNEKLKIQYPSIESTVSEEELKAMEKRDRMFLLICHTSETSTFVIANQYVDECVLQAQKIAFPEYDEQKESKPQHYYKRFATIPVEEVLPLLEKNKLYTFGEHRVRIGTPRLLTYKKGIVCKNCGVGGKYFAIESPLGKYVPHLNLYGIDSQGNEVMLTSDHIIPKSRGGKKGVSNRQCLCIKCNSNKGSSITSDIQGA